MRWQKVDACPILKSSRLGLNYLLVETNVKLMIPL